jgi:alkanesulfonate monooxygenase SsuD/methylene tetrahydromethanopterin reductase-like flavin-dependent oxidoreductase (luciferase family)
VRNTIALVLCVTTSLGEGVMTQARDSVENIVRKLDDQERVAALDRDVPALRRLWSEQFTVNAPNNEVVIERQAVLDTFVGAGVINFSKFERQIEFVRVDGRFVFIMDLETLVPVADAPAAGLIAGRTTRRRFTNIWKDEDGTWRLYARHANVIPSS